jgi:hypothetical protein
MTPLALAKRIRKLRSHPPITAELERAMKARGGTRKVWYRSQKEHWLGWLSEYGGPGYYGRKISSRSAQFVYNHVNCAPMVLWLGEASGVPKPQLKSAKRAALRANPSPAAEAAAVRKIIPWSAIQTLLEGASRPSDLRLRR